MNLDNLKSLGDLSKFLDKVDKVSNNIEDSWKNLSKYLGDGAKNAKAMDNSMGGGMGGTGNGTAGSTMSQPSIGGGGAAAALNQLKQSTLYKNTQEAFGVTGPITARGVAPTATQAGNQFLDKVLNGVIGGIIKPAAIMGYNALPSVEQSFQMNTNKARMSFMGFGGMGGSLANRDAAYAELLRTTAASGTGTSLTDILGGFEGARGLGSNISGIGRSLAAASNITPGVGLTGAASALTGLNAPRNVNFLRMIGVQVRDAATGNMRDIEKIIDDLWNVISRQVRGRNVPITVNDLRLSLQPGNALASMLDQYFGNDQYLRTIVEDGLYAKAQGVSSFDKVSLQGIGATTSAIASKAKREAMSSNLVQMASGPMMFGFQKANETASILSNVLGNMFFNSGPGSSKINPLALIGRLASGGKGFLDTFAGMGNESGGILLSKIGDLLGLIPGLAEGGPTDSRNAYIVGEKGPELFVPETDGRIIPHHELDLNNLQFRGFRHKGGAVATSGPDGSHGHPDYYSGVMHKHGNNGLPGLSPQTLINYLRGAGFKDTIKTKSGVVITPIKDALEIISQESHGNPMAENFTQATGDLSYGLFQVNMQPAYGAARRKNYGITYDWQLYDPATNAKAAYMISHGGMVWKDGWRNSAIKKGLAGPYGNPRGGNQAGGGTVSDVANWFEGIFNKGVQNSGVVGTVVGGAAGKAGAAAGTLADFIKNAAGMTSAVKDFMAQIFNIFKDAIPGLEGSLKNNAREHGGSVTAREVNYGGRGSTVNYGGVTIKIDGKGNWDERKLAQEIKKTLDYDVLMRRAVTH